MTALSPGQQMFALLERLFPICRSITGNGVRKSLEILTDVAPIDVVEVPSGTKVLDWEVPDEWNIVEAYIEDEVGNPVVDFRDHNLHIVGYSVPFEGQLTLEELQPHLHSRPDLPEAIPYVTSYYERRWGFCMCHRDREALKPGVYNVRIDSTVEPGSLTYGEIIVPGRSDKEALIATNICHPSMANNELSGPVLVSHLARWLIETFNGDNRWTYRFLFLPETIGAITYLAKHGDHLKEKVIAGYQAVCVGGPGPLTYLRSRRRETLADRIADHVLKNHAPYRTLEFPERGSDERQWCSLGFDLPVGYIMRSKYHDYQGYHTSLDDLRFVAPDHLEDSFDIYTKCIRALESNKRLSAVVTEGEPNMGRRGLHSMIGGATHEHETSQAMFGILAYADGKTDLLEIADIHNRPVDHFIDAMDRLEQAGLVIAR